MRFRVGWLLPLTRINYVVESRMLMHGGLHQIDYTNEFKIEGNELANTLWWNRIGSSKLWGVTLHSWLASSCHIVLANAKQCHMSLGGWGCQLFCSYLISCISVGVSHLEHNER